MTSHMRLILCLSLQTFLLKVTTTDVEEEGTISVVKSIPCIPDASDDLCVVEVGVKDATYGVFQWIRMLFLTPQELTPFLSACFEHLATCRRKSLQKKKTTQNPFQPTLQ